MIIREPECQLWYFSEEDGADGGEKKGEAGTESAGDSSKAPDIDLPPETRQVNDEDEITKYMERMGIVKKFSCRGRDSPIPTSLYQFIKHHYLWFVCEDQKFPFGPKMQKSKIQMGGAGGYEWEEHLQY